MQPSVFNSLAKKVLIELGITSPEERQISNLENLLSNVSIHSPYTIDVRLTNQEKLCLLLAAFGKTANQTSKILGISPETVKEYRSEIRRKLGCSTIAHAVYQGIRYGLLNHFPQLPPINGG